MSDSLKPQQGSLPYERQPWEEAWMNEKDGEYRAHRERGLDVLHRIEANLPLTEQEEIIAKQCHERLEASKRQNIEVIGEPIYGNDNDTAMILAEQIGTQLIHDERPPEVSG